MPLKKVDSKQITLKCESKIFVAVRTSKQEVKNPFCHLYYSTALQNAAYIYDEIQCVLEKGTRLEVYILVLDFTY